MGDLVKLGSFSNAVAYHRESLRRARRQLAYPSLERCDAAVSSKPLKRSLLPGNTEGLTGSASGLGSLTLDLEAPEVTKTSMLADLLHALKIFSESGVDDVGVNLRIGTVFDASLSVKEPLGDAVI